MARAIDRVRQNAADRAKSLVPLSLRRKVVRARLRFRIATGRYRTLPDFLIIGAQRSGTSSLYKWLSRHPNVVPSLRKEVEYFSIEHLRGERWYRGHFPLAVRRRVAQLRNRPWQTFEATPDYLFDPRAPQRAASLLPSAKLIVLLREPSSRAVSHYHHNVRLNLEELDLVAALQAESARLAPEWPQLANDPGYRATPFRRYSYVARGRYADQLERWLAHFRRSQILIMRSEDLFADPEMYFAEILDFLGLPAWQPPEFRNYSYTNPLAGSYEPPPPAVADFLTEAFDDAGTQLSALLGGSFAWDKSTAS